jgi:hypothetical protein
MRVGKITHGPGETRRRGHAGGTTRILRACKKPLSHAGFCDRAGLLAAERTVPTKTSDECRNTRDERLTKRLRSHSALSRIRQFARCAVQIRSLCSSIRDCMTSPVSSSRLGGQNGEEGKVEDEVRGEEDSAQDREAEGRKEGEEVVLAPRRRDRLRAIEDCVAPVGELVKRTLTRTSASRRFQSTTEGVGEIEDRSL